MKILSDLALFRPVLTALLCLLCGFGMGSAFDFLQIARVEDWFGRFGSVTVAAGIIFFGALTSDLVIRGQVGRLAEENGDSPHPYNRGHLYRVFGLQTLVVVLGTLQWGFGDLLFCGASGQGWTTCG